VFSSLIHYVAQNPSLAKQLFGYAILGFALTEAIAFFLLRSYRLVDAFVLTVALVCRQIHGHSV
jgi:F0F1-type ATP synthase membrane subunit c/vacuolar-type H+-ATPase subunit K